MKYVVYDRVSSDRQEVETQRKNCLGFIKKQEPNGFRYEIYEDEITSKKNIQKRPGIQAALAALQPGDILVGWKLDRLARKAPEIYFLKDYIEKKKAGLLMVTQDISDTMVLAIYAGLAQKETEILSERIRAKFVQKKERGEVIGSIPPYGYKIDKINLIPIKNRDGDGYTMKPGKLIEDEAEQVVLKIMIEMADLGHSFYKIARHLNESGYTNRLGKKFLHISVYRILGRIGRNRRADQSALATRMQKFH